MPPKPKFAWGVRASDLLVHEAVAPINLVLIQGLELSFPDLLAVGRDIGRHKRLPAQDRPYPS